MKQETAAFSLKSIKAGEKQVGTALPGLLVCYGERGRAGGASWPEPVPGSTGEAARKAERGVLRAESQVLV